RPLQIVDGERMTAGHGERLSRDQERAIATLLVSPNYTAAAATLGVHPNTIRSWAKLPHFAAADQAARRDLLANTVAKLQTALHDAVDELTRKLAHPDPEVSLRASELLLAHALKGTETLDLAGKVAALEAEAKR